jgi:hypothetical protein
MWPDGAGMFIDLTERKLGPAALRDALTRAISRKDIKTARDLFEHAFWHKTPFKPDWFHLYIAVDSESRDMVKLLTTYGATWTEDQAKAAKLALGAKCDAVKVILHGAGIRTDYSDKDWTSIAPKTLLEINKRILEENRAAGHDVSAEEKRFCGVLQIELANAVSKNDMPHALHVLKFLADAGKPEGYDVSEVFAHVLGSFLHSSSKRALTFIDRLQEAGVTLQPVDLNKVSSLTLSHHYDLVPELDRRGLLQQDVKKLRGDMINSWSHLQETIDLNGYILHIPAPLIEERHAQFKKAAKTLCTPRVQLYEEDIDYFLRQHRSHLPRAPQALKRMDQALLEAGFFENPAFTANALKNLAAAPGLDAGIAAQFNKIAAQKEIGRLSFDSFLHKKRFAVLENAMQQGAFIPDRVQAEAIVDYLTSQMKNEVPSDGIIQSLKTLKNTGVDLARVQMRDYLGTSKPGMAKALLDLDIIRPSDINQVKLRKRCGPPVNILQGTDSKSKYYAMREFAHQIELEKTDPDRYKPYRGQEAVSYQKLYLLHQLKMISAATRKTQRPDSTPQQENLRQILADHRRRVVIDNRARQERLRKILNDSRADREQKSEIDRARLQKILEQHRRRAATDTDEMRKRRDEILKRTRGNNRFGY